MFPHFLTKGCLAAYILYFSIGYIQLQSDKVELSKIGLTEELKQ